MTNKTYVYDGQEVRKTGRTARKKPRGQNLNRLSAAREAIQIEIEALKDPNTDTTPWKKWVREEELYQIDGEGDDRNLLVEE